MFIFLLFVTLPLCSSVDKLMEGDVALPRSSTGEEVRGSFLLDNSQLWSNGIVPFVFETLQLVNGGEEPLFSDQHKQLIREAMSKISKRVPCIRFR